ncbi:Protein of unknown function [Micrococcales bacterium KH10]|nr:Protein of unknown function [Micrococcales bacterium KH10]
MSRPSGPKGPSQPGDRIVAKRSAKAQFAQTILILEAMVMLFATLAVNTLRSVATVWNGEPPSAGTVWLAGGSLVVILIVFSRLAGSTAGDIAGSVAQIPVLLSAFVLPLMLIVGVVFAAIWFVSLRVGARIDRERAAYDAAHPDTAPNA